MKRNAFTMLELVLVIVVMGILASMAIPRMERDTRQEVADNILSAIRYTQHLALMDDKTDPTDVKWQMLLWHIRFSHYTLTNGDKRWFYTISSNSDHNENVDKNETAIDPQNGLYLFHEVEIRRLMRLIRVLISFWVRITALRVSHLVEDVTVSILLLTILADLIMEFMQQQMTSLRL